MEYSFLRRIPPTILAFFTKTDRYFPEFEWNPNNYTYNAFRLYEAVFGRACGPNGLGDTIRCEARAFSYYDKEKKKRIVLREFYTRESVLVHIEGTIRAWLKAPDFGFRFVPIPQLATPMGGMPMLPPIFSFAIAYDNVSAMHTYPGANPTVSFTVTGSNPLLTLYTRDASTTPTGTYAGTSLVATDAAINNGNFTKSFLLANCATGTNDLVMTCPASAILAMVSYSGCKTTGQPDAHTTATGSSTTATATITTVANNSIGISMTLIQSDGGAASTNVDHVRTFTANYELFGDSNAKATAGSHTMTWSCNNGAWQVHMFSIAPAVAAGPANLKSYNTNLKANTKSINTNPIANVKSLNTNV